jgi:hypothetical protein
MTGPEAMAELRRLIVAELEGPRNRDTVKQMLWSVYWCRLWGGCSRLDELRIRRWQRCERRRGEDASFPGLRLV